jgi:cytoskeletal protein RodZ
LTELGTRLKEAREEKQLTLEVLQERTKIQKRYLEAIERGDFDQLPGNFYTRAFVKSYADAVGLDSEELFREYESILPKSNKEMISNLPPRKARYTESESGSKLLSFLPSILAACLVIGVLAAIWVFWPKEDNGAATPAEPSVTEDSFDVSNEPGSEEAEGDAAEQPPENEAAENDEEILEEVPEEPAEEETKMELVKGETQGDTTVYTLKGTNEFQLAITPISSSWLEVHGENERYLYKTVKENEGELKYDLTSESAVKIRVGHTPAVKIMINGTPFEFPNDRTTQTVNIQFERSTAE